MKSDLVWQTFLEPLDSESPAATPPGPTLQDSRYLIYKILCVCVCVCVCALSYHTDKHV
jgi:hypothetical protein